MAKNDKINWLRLSSIGVQMGITIYLFAQLGKFLDSRYQLEKPWFALSLSMIGVGISMFLLFKTIKKMN
ncbi:AtpZ/AtpI family protein [Weeksellaceae bacterium TAE3-ERU29]|nr:AtpZ/AtpI family protein [Weeksellaceae bacterium TAE3-ERU29]